MFEFWAKSCSGVCKNHRVGLASGDSIEGIRSWLFQVIDIP
jgi:hypothetical protein